MEGMLELTFMSGPRDGEKVHIHLKNGLREILIGRTEECDLCCPSDHELSRWHARLFQKGNNTWQLEDLHSTNGTYLGEFKNAWRIGEPVTLNYNEIFRVGRTCLRLEPPNTNEMNISAQAYAKIEF